MSFELSVGVSGNFLVLEHRSCQPGPDRLLQYYSSFAIDTLKGFREVVWDRSSYGVDVIRIG